MKGDWRSAESPSASFFDIVGEQEGMRGRRLMAYWAVRSLPDVSCFELGLGGLDLVLWVWSERVWLWSAFGEDLRWLGVWPAGRVGAWLVGPWVNLRV